MYVLALKLRQATTQNGIRYEEEKKWLQNFKWKNWRKEASSESSIEEYNIKIARKQIGLESADSICVTQASRKWRAVVKTLKNLEVAQKLGKFLSSWGTKNFTW